LCEIDAELQLGITITRDDITQLEFVGLRLLADERERVRRAQSNMDDARQITHDRAKGKPARGF